MRDKSAPEFFADRFARNLAERNEQDARIDQAIKAIGTETQGIKSLQIIRRNKGVSAGPLVVPEHIIGLLKAEQAQCFHMAKLAEQGLLGGNLTPSNSAPLMNRSENIGLLVNAISPQATIAPDPQDRWRR